MRWRLPVALLGAALAWPALVGHAQEADDPAPDPEALALMRGMAEALAQAERLATVVDVAYEVVQEDGEILEFGGRRTLSLRRPDGLRVENQRRDGQRGGLVFDGQRIVLFDSDEEVYASIDHPGDVDAAIDFLQARLATPLPLGELFESDVVATLVGAAETGGIVGVETLREVSCHHLAFRNDAVDFQLWVQREGPPLLRRVVIVYHQEEGAPRFRADFDSWDFAPALADATFAYVPAEGVERIPFVVPRRSVAAEEGVK